MGFQKQKYSSLIFGLTQCEGLIDPNKTYAELIPEIKNSYYGKIKLKDSLNMMARDNKLVKGHLHGCPIGLIL